MFSSQNSAVSSNSQVPQTIRTNRGVEFPTQATITNPDVIFYTNEQNPECRAVKHGEVVTLTGRRALTVFTFKAADGVEGHVFARGVEVK